MSKSPKLQAALEAQAARKAAEAHVERIARACDEHGERAQETIRRSADDLATLQAEREHVLADIALGEDRAERLAELDTGIAAARMGLDPVHASDTIAGLRDRLEGAKADLEHARNVERDAIREALLERQQSASLRYRTAALASLEAIGVVLGYQALLRRVHGSTRGLPAAFVAGIGGFLLSPTRFDTDRRWDDPYITAPKADQAGGRALPRLVAELREQGLDV